MSLPKLRERGGKIHCLDLQVLNNLKWTLNGDIVCFTNMHSVVTSPCIHLCNTSTHADKQASPKTKEEMKEIHSLHLVSVSHCTSRAQTTMI